MPAFSVIIPTYNRLPLLRVALRSLQQQAFRDFEVIVVDDGSTDGTWEALETGEMELRTVRRSNGGPGAARNAGAAVAKGKYLAFLDSDDLFLPWALETYAAAIIRCESPAFLAGKSFRFGQESELSGVSSAPLQINFFPDYFASGSEWRWWGVSSFVIRREAFEGIGGFTDEWVNGEDVDLTLRLGTSPGFVQVFEPATFGYREHANSAMENFSKTLAGTWRSLRLEQSGQYPGGVARAWERRQIISRHTRPVAFRCLTEGLARDGWNLYRTLFPWQVGLGRWKFLFGFPIKALLAQPK